MKCSCYFDNNYEIIGPCNMEEFNEKISEFEGRAWTQLTISDKVEIPNEKPSVRHVEKVYLNIKIKSTKIINTPISNKVSIENLNLTGKALSIYGEIFQKIIYFSDTTPSRAYSMEYTIPFNTYMVIEKDVSLENDEYSVYAYVENVFIKPIGERNINTNVALFLFANRTTEKYVEKLQNKIIVKSKGNKTVLTIEFNKEDEQFIVKSTGEIPDPSSNEPYFTLVLENRISGKEGLRAILNSNESGKRFKGLVNNKDYTLGIPGINRLFIIYKDKTKIEITNHPKDGETYIPKEDFDVFEITPDGLVNKLLNSKIKIVNDNDKELSTIGFMSTGSFTRILVTSTDNISTNRLEMDKMYAQMLLYSASLGSINGIIFGRQTSNEFMDEINRKSLGTGFPIKLNCRFPNKIKITNYRGVDEYLVRQEPEFLTTDLFNIIPYELNYDKIVLKNLDGSNVVFIYFDKGREKLFIYSTGVINSDSDNFSIKITDSSGTYVKLREGINKNQNADSINTPTLRSFSFGDILELSYSISNLVEIINNQGVVYKPTGSSERFRIDRSGLIPI